jgi:hypothetical protein
MSPIAIASTRALPIAIKQRGRAASPVLSSCPASTVGPLRSRIIGATTDRLRVSMPNLHGEQGEGEALAGVEP